jgi:hypothetical protein
MTTNEVELDPTTFAGRWSNATWCSAWERHQVARDDWRKLVSQRWMMPENVVMFPGDYSDQEVKCATEFIESREALDNIRSLLTGNQEEESA